MSKRPLGVRFDTWVNDVFFNDPKWWDNRKANYRPWRGKTFNIVAGFSEWVRTHSPHDHLVVDDHCGKPEHRYCEWCSKTQPNAELSPY